MLETINAMFFEKVLSGIDVKYKDTIKESLDKTFLYSNLYEFPEYYRIFSSKKNKNYHIDSRILNTRGLETYEFVKTFIQTNNFDSECIMMFYGLIATKVLKKYIKGYTNGMTKSLLNSQKIKELKEEKLLSNIEALYFYKETGIKLYKSKPLRDKDLLFNDTAKECYKNLMNDVYLFNLGYRIYKKGIKSYRKIDNYLFPNFMYLPRIFLSILNLFVRNKKYSLQYLAKPHHVNSLVDYLNVKKKTWVLFDNEVDYSFDEVLEIAIKEAIALINMASEDLHYHKESNNLIEAIEAL